MKVKDNNRYYSEEWVKSNKIALKYNKILKFTIPGPMTICGTITNKFYQDERSLCQDLIPIIRREIIYLKEMGCTEIQIDEPLFARNPQEALDWGIDFLNQIIKDISGVFFTVHMCCGYPSHLDQKDYLKADKDSYKLLSKSLDKSLIDAISIEDAHCKCQDLSFIKNIKNKTIVFGAIAIANSRIETVAEIEDRIKQLLQYIPKERLIIAPDCGLGYLPKPILISKLKNMVEAAKNI